MGRSLSWAIIPVATLIAGVVLGSLVLGDKTTTCGCRDLPDEDFYQLSTDDMSMWVEGAQIQTDDEELLRQLRQIGYRVYVPLCPAAQARVIAEGKRRGLQPEGMEPWELEMVIRLGSR